VLQEAGCPPSAADAPGRVPQKHPGVPAEVPDSRVEAGGDEGEGGVGEAEGMRVEGHAP